MIYGIVTDESMGNAVKVTVIATGFSRGPRKAAPTPVDLVNYINPPAATAPPLASATDSGGFYRKAPNPKAAAAGGGGRIDLDVPAFLRKQGSGGGSTE